MAVRGQSDEEGSFGAGSNSAEAIQEESDYRKSKPKREHVQNGDMENSSDTIAIQ